MPDRPFWLAWSQIPGIGSVLLRRLEQQFGSLAAAWSAPSQELMAVNGIGGQLAEAIVTARSQVNPQALLEQHRQQHLPFWTPADADYPRLLLETPSYPPVLYYQGQVKPEENQGLAPMVAIVGTRHPSDYGRRWTRKLTIALVNQGFTIVSGLAEGIDAVAHQSCLEAGGRTIAVLGTGLDLVYPSSNRRLYQEILRQGLALSEYPKGTQADRTHFPQRNRIVAGLVRAVVVTEAPEKSGALITAHMANDYGRDVYVLPGALDNPRCLGCLGLISKGAQVILSEAHLLEMLGTMPSLDGTGPLTPAPQPLGEQLSLLALAPELQQVLQVLPTEPIAFDWIVQQLELNAGAVSGALLQLELQGFVTQLPGMRYQRCG